MQSLNTARLAVDYENKGLFLRCRSSLREKPPTTNARSSRWIHRRAHFHYKIKVHMISRSRFSQRYRTHQRANDDKNKCVWARRVTPV
mgnify:CR=1 FL=1